MLKVYEIFITQKKPAWSNIPMIMKDMGVHCCMILNGNIFQTAPSSEFPTGSSLEKYVLSQLTNSELDLVWNSKLDLVWNSEVGSVWNWKLDLV